MFTRLLKPIVALRARLNDTALARRWKRLSGWVRIGFWVLLGLAIAVVLLRGAGDMFIRIDNGDDMVTKAARPTAYATEVQVVRMRCWTQKLEPRTCPRDPAASNLLVNETQSVRSLNVDTERNAFTATLLNVYEDPKLREAIMVGDGTDTVLSPGDLEKWRRLADPVTVQDIRPPDPDDMLNTAPELVSTQDTVRGQQAYKVSFTPTGAIIDRLLMTAPLGLEGEDITAIRAGRYTVEYADAWFAADGRYLMQMDMAIVIAKGARYRFVAQWWNIGQSELEGVNV